MTTAGEAVVLGPGVTIGGEATVGGGISPGEGVIVVPGPPGSGSAHEHVQADASDVWIVDHNLGRRPAAWSLYDQQDRLRDEYLVEHPTVNRAVVRMDVPTAGRIRMI